MTERTAVTLPQFSEDDRREIVRILSGRGRDPAIFHRPGARIGYLLREYPMLVASVRAQLVLRNLGDLMKPATEPENTCTDWYVSVPASKLAQWAGCTPRSVQTAIQQLTKAGWPLLMSRPGRPGRASEYRLVLNPFAFAEKQIENAKAARARRHPKVIEKQLAAIHAERLGEITPVEARARQKRASEQRDWNCPTPAWEKAVVAALHPWPSRVTR